MTRTPWRSLIEVSGVVAARHQPTPVHAAPYNSQVHCSQGATTPGGSPYLGLQTGQTALPGLVNGLAGMSVYNAGSVTAQHTGYVSLDSPTHMHNPLPLVTQPCTIMSSSIKLLDAYYLQAAYHPPPSQPGLRAITRDLSSRDFEMLMRKHQLESQRNKSEDFSKVCRLIHSCILPPTGI